MEPKDNKRLFLFLIFCILLAAGFLAVLFWGGNTTVTNTFTMGRVEITMDESAVTVWGEKNGTGRVMGNTYKLVPGRTYIQDPTIHVSQDSEDCWLFVKVVNNIADIEAEGDTAIAAQMAGNGWNLLAGTTDIYALATPVSAGTEVVVFSSFTIQGESRADTDRGSGAVHRYESQAVVLTAYAVEADGYSTAPAAWEDSFGQSADS